MTSRTTPAQTPTALLRDKKPLRALVDQAGRLDLLQRLVEEQLQPAAREHCKAAAYREGCLLLVISDGHWATRLRYQQRRLLRQLQMNETFTGLERIVFKVQPVAPIAAGLAPPEKLSTNAADALRSAASGIENPALRSALERLARHTQRS
jgi:hypothetical protein